MGLGCGRERKLEQHIQSGVLPLLLQLHNFHLLAARHICPFKSP